MIKEPQGPQKISCAIISLDRSGRRPQRRWTLTTSLSLQPPVLPRGQVCIESSFFCFIVQEGGWRRSCSCHLLTCLAVTLADKPLHALAMPAAPAPPKPPPAPGVRPPPPPMPGAPKAGQGEGGELRGNLKDLGKFLSPGAKKKK